MSKLCKKHECIHSELPCPLCVIEERDSLEAEVEQLRGELNESHRLAGAWANTARLEREKREQMEREHGAVLRQRAGTSRPQE